MKNRINKKCYIIIAILIFLISLLIVLTTINNKDVIKLIQLSPQGSRQMMGYLIKTNNGKLIIIDGGTIEDTDNLIKNINKNGGKVDYWFITHAHDDHAGAFTQIANNEQIEILNIYASLNEYEWYEKNEPNRAEFSKLLIDTLNKDEIKDRVKTPELNEKIVIDGIKVEVLGIRNPEILENAGNEQSMVLKFDTGNTTLLILGDAGEKSSEKLLINQKDKLKSDIVQMAHHGQSGATKQLYEEVNPKICLWPTPDWLWNNDAGEGINTRTLENY